MKRLFKVVDHNGVHVSGATKVFHEKKPLAKKHRNELNAAATQNKQAARYHVTYGPDHRRDGK